MASLLSTSKKILGGRFLAYSRKLCAKTSRNGGQFRDMAIFRQTASSQSSNCHRRTQATRWALGVAGVSVAAVALEQRAALCDYIHPRQKDKAKIAMCQTNVTKDKALNIKTVEAAIKDAAAASPDMILLGECWNCPYATDQFPIYAEPVPNVGDTSVNAKESPSVAMMMRKAKEHGVYLIGGSVPERSFLPDGTQCIYNTCICVDPSGKVVAKHRKMHLFDIDVPGRITFKESDTLTAGDTTTSFETPFGKVGVAICYDIRFPELGMLMREEGCVMLVYPGAFNMTTGPAHWELLQRARAVDNQLYVVAVSPARSPIATDYQAWGHTTVVSPWGDILAKVEGEKQGPATLFCDIDMTKVDEFRTNVPTALQKRDDVYIFGDRHVLTHKLVEAIASKFDPPKKSEPMWGQK